MALIQCDFFSDVLGICCSMNVILPQKTRTQIGMKSVRTYEKSPVLYLLHGYSDDHTIWLRRTSIERYVADKDLAVIMPAVNKSYYTDMAQGDNYWTFISEELPEIARSFFHLSDRREDNFVAGLSMGGYGAFKLALRNPKQFSYAASLSGALMMAQRVNRMSTNPDEHFNEERQREFEAVFGDLQKVVGSDNDLKYLAEKRCGNNIPLPKLYQCCGTEDFLFEGNIEFRDHLNALNYDLTYHEGPGTHEWGYWDKEIQNVIDWLPLS